jgi:hypothetical protein
VSHLNEATAGSGALGIGLNTTFVLLVTLVWLSLAVKPK